MSEARKIPRLYLDGWANCLHPLLKYSFLLLSHLLFMILR